MNQSLSSLIDDIANLPSDLHKAGTVPPDTIHAIARHAQALGPIHHSAETGAGKTTMLFSQLSAHHLVFALNEPWDESVSSAKNSALLNKKSVTFIEGPSQLTLPRYKFEHKLQIALIDGPHGYPFPDLEYYYFYPLIEKEGLLLVDDIQIPSIRRMFEIIKACDMFELIDISGNNLAFFRRTGAPLIDPLSDSWWLQGYNRAHYARITGTEPVTTPSEDVSAGSSVTPPATPVGASGGRILLRVASAIPRPIRKLVPEWMKSRLRRFL